MTEKPKIWAGRELYAEFARHLLAANPQNVEVIREKCGKRWIYREIQSGGYWGKYNKQKRIKNYWIYTKVIRDGKPKIVEVINYARWARVMETYFAKAAGSVIRGEFYAVGGSLGTIAARHIERNYSNRKVNFQETAKQEKVFDAQLGRMKAAKVIYFDDSSYIRIGWNKHPRVPQSDLYEFVPEPLFKRSFSKANQKSEVLKLSYEWFPYVNERQELRKLLKNGLQVG